MRGKAKYELFTLMGIREADGLAIRLGRAQTLHTARGLALGMVRRSSGWRHIEIRDKRDRVISKVTRPAV